MQYTGHTYRKLEAYKFFSGGVIALFELPEISKYPLIILTLV